MGMELFKIGFGGKLFGFWGIGVGGGVFGGKGLFCGKIGLLLGVELVGILMGMGMFWSGGVGLGLGVVGLLMGGGDGGGVIGGGGVILIKLWGVGKGNRWWKDWIWLFFFFGVMF